MEASSSLDSSITINRTVRCSPQAKAVVLTIVTAIAAIVLIGSILTILTQQGYNLHGLNFLAKAIAPAWAYIALVLSTITLIASVLAVTRMACRSSNIKPQFEKPFSKEQSQAPEITERIVEMKNEEKSDNPEVLNAINNVLDRTITLIKKHNQKELNTIENEIDQSLEESNNVREAHLEITTLGGNPEFQSLIKKHNQKELNTIENEVHESSEESNNDPEAHVEITTLSGSREFQSFEKSYDRLSESEEQPVGNLNKQHSENTAPLEINLMAAFNGVEDSL